jgi:hypothetical protein
MVRSEHDVMHGARDDRGRCRLDSYSRVFGRLCMASTGRIADSTPRPEAGTKQVDSVLDDSRTSAGEGADERSSWNLPAGKRLCLTTGRCGHNVVGSPPISNSNDSSNRSMTMHSNDIAVDRRLPGTYLQHTSRVPRRISSLEGKRFKQWEFSISRRFSKGSKRCSRIEKLLSPESPDNLMAGQGQKSHEFDTQSHNDTTEGSNRRSFGTPPGIVNEAREGRPAENLHDGG